MRKFLRCALSVGVLGTVLATFYFFPTLSIVAPGPVTEKQELLVVDENEVKEAASAFLRQAYASRAEALITGDTNTLDPLYGNSKYARWALEHEQGRVRYTSAWQQIRGVRFTGSGVELRIRSMTVSANPLAIKATLSLSTRIDYTVLSDPLLRQDSFGIGTRHYVQLSQADGQWVIRKEWYVDPLEEDSLVSDVTPALGTFQAVASVLQAAAKPSSYQRQAAVDYGKKYAGFAWGAGNDGNYNKRYRDYNGQGGDCTNYVSQCLGDEGGALPMDGSWFYGKGGGSQAWVQTKAFKEYILWSGKGVLVARGTYDQVTEAKGDRPHGAVSLVKPGDVIGYQEKGGLVHFALITGYSTAGYPLVNSHTADRNQVPWDLGWDRKTVFWLIRIR